MASLWAGFKAARSGVRSFAVPAARHDIKDTLNLKIKRRESFRPLAPSILRRLQAVEALTNALYCRLIEADLSRANRGSGCAEHLVQGRRAGGVYA